MWKCPIINDYIDLKDHLESDKIKKILINRGLNSHKDIEEYINPSPLPNPLAHFPDLQKATTRIIESITSKDKIAICGDYDADGMTSTALIVDVIKKLKGQPIPFIPSRIDEGYGLNKSIVKQIHNEGINLIITVDNGVSASTAIKEAKLLGIDIILTDHHKINESLDDIYALVHPEVTPINSPYKSLAGVGVAYILAQQLAIQLNQENVLNISRDLLCVGTIADMASLNGANRYWLKKWLHLLSKTECLGLKGLIKNARITNSTITSTDISYRIAPRINSIGRIDDPKLIIDLFLETNESSIKHKLKECEDINKRRKKISKAIEEEAMSILGKENNKIGSFILLAQSHWHHGVIGIVAARLSNIYNKPTAIVSSEGGGIFRGSVRSPKGFNIINALNKCSDLLEKYGGHKSAAGFSVNSSNLVKLENKLQSIAEEWYNCKNNINNLSPECHLSFSEINDFFIEEYIKLEPFGIGNEKPIFWSRGINVIKYNRGYLGQLILSLKQDDNILEAIIWDNIYSGDRFDKKIDIAFNIDYKTTKKGTIISLNIIDYRITEEKVAFKINNRIYRCYLDKKHLLTIENQNNKSFKYNLLEDAGVDDFINYNDAYIKYLIKTSLSVLGLE